MGRPEGSLYDESMARMCRSSSVKGNSGAPNFLAGLMVIVWDSGYAGLVLVVDNVEIGRRQSKNSAPPPITCRLQVGADSKW